MTEHRAIRSRKVVFPDGTRPATIVLKGGLIESIEPYDSETEAVDYGELAILPGAVDVHVHFNEPGRTHWEGWETGTKAALAGGVTTVIEMPLNSIPSTVDAESLQTKLQSMEGKLFCDVGLWGGAVPGNTEALESLVKGGVRGLKCFLSDPGTEEFENLEYDDLKSAMQKVAEIDSVLLAHAEWPAALRETDPSIPSTSYEAWLSTRPPEAEREAIRHMIELAEETGCRAHIVHVSTPEVLDLFEGTDVTCETCAHYLVFSAEEIADRATNFKCAPPIREKVHQDGLWQALKEGKIQMVTSDHSPCPPDLKNDDFLSSWGGIAGVQMLVSAFWTGASVRGFSLSDAARLLAQNPAKLAGLSDQIGEIKPGLKANLMVLDPDASFECTKLQHRHAGSPYEGRNWKGVVKAVYLAGNLALENGDFVGRHGHNV